MKRILEDEKNGQRKYQYYRLFEAVMQFLRSFFQKATPSPPKTTCFPDKNMV